MKYRQFTHDDCIKYAEDLADCYKCNRYVLDSQSPLDLSIPHNASKFIDSYVSGLDSSVLGIFDDNEQFCYGVIIYDNIRFANRNSAQVHIVTDKAIWGKRGRDLYNKIIDEGYFHVLYCEIPAIATHAIGLCKRLGFKKTGYIPSVIPYVNSEGKERMYDYQIYTFEKEMVF